MNQRRELNARCGDVGRGRSAVLTTAYQPSFGDDVWVISGGENGKRQVEPKVSRPQQAL